MTDGVPTLDCVQFVRTTLHARLLQLYRDVVRWIDMQRRDVPPMAPLTASPASQLALALSLAQEDAPRDRPYNITALRTALAPFVETHGLGRPIDGALRDLLDDLTIVELFERGGLDALNAWVAERMMWLREPERTRDEMREENRRLNDVLYRLLYVYPLAVGIVIRLQPNCGERTEAMYRRFDSEHHRGSFNRFLKRYAEERESSFEGPFVVPTPFSFTTRTHGSGERAAGAQSYRSVAFTTLDQRDRRERSTAALAFMIEAPILVPHLTHFTLDEIVEFRVTDAADAYTPYESYRDDRPQLLGRGHPLSHYFRFRNFSGLLSTERDRRLRDRLPDLTEEEARVVRAAFIEPAWADRVLWWVNYQHPEPDHLHQGFLAEIPEIEGDSVLYEFVDSDFAEADHGVSKAVLFIEARRRAQSGALDDHLRVYRGRDAIIRRLGVLPVSPRTF